MKNVAELDRPQMTVWCIHIACWITKAANTGSEYVILIGFLLQQWLHECDSVLHYMYIACLVFLLGGGWEVTFTLWNQFNAILIPLKILSN